MSIEKPLGLIREAPKKNYNFEIRILGVTYLIYQYI